MITQQHETFERYIEKTVDDLLPYTQEDKKCMAKSLIKKKNREQLKRILETFIQDPYCDYRFIKR
jgi:DNA topoisomerase VI subunit B